MIVGMGRRRGIDSTTNCVKFHESDSLGSHNRGPRGDLAWVGGGRSSCVLLLGSGGVVCMLPILMRSVGQQANNGTGTICGMGENFIDILVCMYSLHETMAICM